MEQKISVKYLDPNFRSFPGAFFYPHHYRFFFKTPTPQTFPKPQFFSFLKLTRSLIYVDLNTIIYSALGSHP